MRVCEEYQSNLCGLFMALVEMSQKSSNKVCEFWVEINKNDRVSRDLNGLYGLYFLLYKRSGCRFMPFLLKILRVNSFELCLPFPYFLEEIISHSIHSKSFSSFNFQSWLKDHCDGGSLERSLEIRGWKCLGTVHK